MLADELAISAAGRTARRSSSRSNSARLAWLAGQDLLVVRELAVDQARDEVDPVEVEQHLVAGLGEHELDGVVRVGEDPAQLVEGAGRDDDRDGLDGVEDVDRPDGDAVVVGGREGEAAALEAGEDAGQDRARLVAGRREDRLLERLA